jgi:REP element-mobilizing transposase RayT
MERKDQKTSHECTQISTYEKACTGGQFSHCNILYKDIFMTRPLRIEYPGAFYHITSRGDRREAIFDDDEDMRLFLRVLSEVVGRFNWLCYAYCLMDNHYHLLVETPDENLSRGMRQLNGVYTQASNRRHSRTGHLFAGRFKGILVDKEHYFLELTRYVVLNPQRAGMVNAPHEWLWSSYQSMVGDVPAPGWLAMDGLLAHFGRERAAAQQRYRQFVSDGIGMGRMWSDLRQQIYLGDEQFVERVQAKAQVKGDQLTIPRVQRRAPPPTLTAIAAQHADRNDAMVAAYATGAYGYREIAGHFGLHLATVGRIVRQRMLTIETPSNPVG